MSIPKRSIWEFLLLAIVAIAVLLRIVYLGHREFWYDEVLSLLLSTGQKTAYQGPTAVPVNLANYTSLLRVPAESSFNDTLATVANLLRGLAAEPHPPLFFLGQHLWLRLFGNSEAAVRSLGALFSIGAIGSAYGLGRSQLGHRGGLLLAALLGVNPFYLFHSLNVRMYGPLVLWTLLSAWALLELIGADRRKMVKDRESSSLHSPLQPVETSLGKLGRVKSRKPHFQLFWSLIFIGSVTAGLMTFYYFAIWLVALAAVALLDRQRWWQYWLYLGAGTLITTPWVLWGTRQQLRNADLNRFAASDSWLETVLTHFGGVAQTLGIHLLIGDWASSLPPIGAIAAGIGAILLLLFCSLSLWHRQQQRALGIALLLGVFPLLLMLAIDVIGGKYTIGFGMGRSTIFILPGCLLLLATWIERAAGRWQQPAASALLLLYLSISIADLSYRPRQMFHQLASVIKQEPATPTLIALNSRAWGHVLRLAYYLPPEAPVSLLAQNPAKLAIALEKLDENQYPRLIWLDSARSVWSEPGTEAQRLSNQKQIQAAITSQYRLEATQPLSGTMDLDTFTAYIYEPVTNEQ